MNVFIIDDDEEEVEIMAEALYDISSSIDVQVCTDPEEAVQLLKHHTQAPDVILLDNMMPKLNAVEVIDSIRLLPNLKNSRIVVLSNDISPADESTMGGLGIEVVRKGQSFDSIIRSLQTILFPEKG